MSMTRAREILLGRILVLHLQPLVGIERRQVVEIDLVARLVRVLEIDRVDLQQREVALAFFRRTDMAFDGVAGAQAEAADLRGRDVDVVRAGEVVRFRRAQEAEAVGENLDDAFADDVDFLLRELFEDREHQLLLAHGAGVFDFLFFGEGEELDRGFDLEVLKFHFPHWGLVLLCGIRLSFDWKSGSRDGSEKEKVGLVRFLRSGLGHYGIGAPARCLRDPTTRKRAIDLASACVWWDALNIRNKRRFRKRRAITNASCLWVVRTASRSPGSRSATIRTAGTSLIIL